MKHEMRGRYAATGLWTGLCRVASLLVALPLLPATAQTKVARVAAVQAVTQKKAGPAGTWQKADIGTALNQADSFRTGKRSKADLLFTDNSLLRLGQLSSIDIRGGKEVRLTGGRVLFVMLKPGRILAGSAAAEIKGSVGIVILNPDGSQDYTLFSGVMDIVTPRGRFPLPPGQHLHVLPDGIFGRPTATAALPFAGGELYPRITEAPVDGPYVGSVIHVRERHQPTLQGTTQRLIDLSSTIKVTYNPFSAVSLPPPPVPVPFPTPPDPVPNPFPTIAPGTLALRRGAAATTSTDGAAPGATLRRVALQDIAPSAPATAARVEAARTQPAGLEGDQGLDLRAALAHFNAAERTVGGGSGSDFRFTHIRGNHGLSVVGGRLHAFGTRGRWFLDGAVTPVRVTASGSGAPGRSTVQLTTVSEAGLTYRDRRGDVRVGRQRFMEGPAQATLFGSMIRQGGRETMDAVRVSPKIGKGRRLDLAYIKDAFPRDLPFRVNGYQSGLYLRYAWQQRYGNFGLNLLKYRRAPVAHTTGATLDFGVPLVRNQLELFGELGRDPFRRRLTTLGLYFPGLYQKTDFDVYLEYASLKGSTSYAGPPNELALRIYRRLNQSVDLMAAWSRLSGVEHSFIFGITSGARFTSEDEP